MDYVEAEGDTIDEAIENALKMLGASRDRVTVDILAEGRRGILGIGTKKARVRASLRKTLALDTAGELEERSAPPEARISEEERERAGDKAKEVLAEILRLMGLQATIELRPGGTHEEIVLDVQGVDGGFLIGHKGQTLEALHYLLSRIVTERRGREGPQLILDAGNYQERRRKSLEDMALRLGEKAKRQRRAVTVGTFSAADRRIIHLALQDDPWITTKSLGRGVYRRVLIVPEGDRRSKEDDKGQPLGKNKSDRQK